MNNAPRPAPGGVFVQFAGEGSDDGAAETSAKGSEGALALKVTVMA